MIDRTRPKPPTPTPPSRCGHTSSAASANLAVRGVDHLLAVVSNRLKHIQYRPDLLDGFLTHTGLTIEPDPT